MSATIPIIIQARLGSSRCPGKVLAPLAGQPMLLWPLARLTRMLPVAHPLIVASAHTAENLQRLVPLLRRHGYTVLAPEVPEDDVLARYLAIAEAYEAEAVVRVTGDCPLLDPALVSLALQRYYQTGCDYVAQTAEWPDGVDVEVIKTTALREAAASSTLPSDREHVSSYLWKAPDVFRHVLIPCPLDLSAHCWSVDTPHDLSVATRLLTACLQQYGLTFGWVDVWTTLFTQPTLLGWATSRARNAAYMAQLAEEQGQTQADDWQTVRYGGHKGCADGS